MTERSLGPGQFCPTGTLPVGGLLGAGLAETFSGLYTPEPPPIQSFSFFSWVPGVYDGLRLPLSIPESLALYLQEFPPVISFSSNSVLTLAFHRT